jgi:hypothetical protein
MRARLPPLRVLLPHTHIHAGWMVSATKTPTSSAPSQDYLFPLYSSSLTHTRRMDGFCNQNADQLSALAGLSFPVVYVGVVECAPASPYKRHHHHTPPPHTGFPMSAHLSRLLLFHRHLRSLFWVWVWVWDWVHTPPHTLLHTLLSFSPPSFHTISLSLAFTSA